MADEKRSRKNKKTPPVHVVTPETQKNSQLHVRAGDLNSEMVKEMFMKCEFVEWSPFCGSMKWNPNSTRLKYPVAQWVREKKENLAKIQAEEIGDLIFRHKPQWHKDVLKVLKTAPEIVDQVDALLRYRINQISRLINSDIEAKQKALLDNQPYDEFEQSQFLKKVKTSELESLVRAGKEIVDAKQRSVLIHNWSVPVAEEFSKPETIMNEQESKGFTIQIIGQENVTSADLQRWRQKYYDVPQLPEIPIEKLVNEEPDGNS